ncbi:peptidase S16 [Niveispirillum sp. SYP-B3756]|uniref:LON peptidase substrate-binding domain-containing protein n=1 Tax=Niveispirillum sp. SYP-B3756 TaxID=2662178 RepID=UPI001292AD17|nr:LON peptidase substrate-binding domain-containing protein [Niveispirillum sp. SYP-B3756]MQP66914.1 peptidase S16 [Niveispirillum sp. SYP-B3756]
MSRNPFDPTPETLPSSIPVFPLTGVLLLPRGKLPLNIFEPRYLNMVQDALAADRMIGMIQPQPGGGAVPVLYRTGCAGRITSFSETDDGRLLITLTGISRFLITQEVATMRGYRRVIPDWSPFTADLAGGPETAALDRGRLDRALRGYFQLQGIDVDWNSIARTADERLVSTLAMICPFTPPEKQALLESPGPVERAEMLLTLLEMAVHDPGADSDHSRH